MQKKILRVLLVVVGVIGLGIILYHLPPVHERLAWRVEALRSDIKYALNPPEKTVFIPEGVTPTAGVATVTPTPLPTLTPTLPGPTDTPAPSPTPTITPTPLPESVKLSGVRFQSQRGLFNYCAPANLAMGLSYWGWKGDRLTVGKVLKPYDKDKNVMPYEMVDYVNEYTELRATVRYAGDLNRIKTFLANGFPVLVEKGEILHGEYGPGSEGWMGHYMLFTGYDEAGAYLVGQDSLTGPDAHIPYAELDWAWRNFNYAYIIIYPAEQESTVMTLLGTDADVTANYQRAAERASYEVVALSGVDQFWAWYNRGTSLNWLEDYGGAAAAYDQAFALYSTLPEADRPWRYLWYQTGPYFAYYYTGRYYDVLNLANQTLDGMAEPILEESYYWRALAKAALGDSAGAIEDLRTALKYHKGFAPALAQLERMGVTP